MCLFVKRYIFNSFGIGESRGSYMFNFLKEKNLKKLFSQVALAFSSPTFHE